VGVVEGVVYLYTTLTTWSETYRLPVESKVIPVAEVSPETTTAVAVVPDAEFAGIFETLELGPSSVVTQMFELLSRAMAKGLLTV
jgi:hypothetical protein